MVIIINNSTHNYYNSNVASEDSTAMKNRIDEICSAWETAPVEARNMWERLLKDGNLSNSNSNNAVTPPAPKISKDRIKKNPKAAGGKRKKTRKRRKRKKTRKRKRRRRKRKRRTKRRR